MNAKAAITIMLGLVFQLAQVLPAAVLTSPCQTTQASCKCCMGADSCHCAQNSKSDQTPAPAPLPSDSVLKIPTAKSAETKVAVELTHVPQSTAVIANLPGAGPVFGFTGVRLSVAFCSFVI